MLRVARRFAREVRKATSLQSYDVREELVLWDFRRPDSLREWSCISDRDMGGYSTASLDPNGKGRAKNMATGLFIGLPLLQVREPSSTGASAWSDLPARLRGTAVTAPSGLSRGRWVPNSTPRHTRCTRLDLSRQEKWMESGLYDVSGYDALQLRVRGDGRRFIANVGAPSMARQDDIWQAFVFTRGGPEWEDISVRSTHL